MTDPGLALVQTSFQDFEAFLESIHGWTVDFVQLDRGSCELEMLQAVTENVHLGRFRFNRLFEQAGESPPGLRTFALPGERSSPVRWRHQPAAKNAVLAVPKDRELNAVSQPGFEGLTLSFSDAMLRQMDELLDVPLLAGLPPEQESIPCDPTAVARLRRYILNLCEELGRLRPDRPRAALRRELEEELPRQFVRALASSHDARPVPSTRRRRQALRRALEVIDEDLAEDLSVAEVCRLVGVSDRTLRYAFVEHFGVPPKTYLRSLRLNRARRDLIAADPGTTRVIDVANRWGFWHMGQFSGDYRRLFDELPSETLRRV